MSGRDDEPPVRRNPFSPMAVAKITGFDETTGTELHIDTDASRRAVSYLTEYLENAPNAAGGDRGEVIAIAGDYGTGKTHLAVRIVLHARAVLTDPVRAMYLDATADSFLELYRRFMRKVGLRGVRTQVNDYYADIVAESLQGTGLDAQVVEWFHDRALVPRDVVDQLGLMESALLRKVRQTLLRVTDDSDFGTALTLLLRSGFDEAVWSWLTGEQPDRVLVDRGVTRPIDTDVAALEAMGVFALLFGGRQARFVLVLDELDKIFSAANRPREDIVTAFQKLLEVFAKAGACLVLSGLPEFLHVLSPSARQRIPHVVEMAPLSADEVSDFIRLAHRERLGRDELAPFTHETARYLRDIAGGNARRVIHLCHDVFRAVEDEVAETGNPDVKVSDEMVREAARRQFGALSADDIHAVVRRILDANGWAFQPRHYLGTDRESIVDFWLGVGEQGGGCAVLISGSVLDEADADAVTRRVFAVQQAAPNARVVLLVNGVLADVYAAALREALGREPLVYVEHGFEQDFKALVGVASNELARTEGAEEPLGAVQRRLEQISRQQSSIYGFLERLVEHVDGLRSSSDRRIAAIQREFTALTTDPGRAVPGLPPDVDRLFAEALDALDDLTQVDVMLAEVFGGAGEFGGDVRGRLTQPAFFESIGTSAAAQDRAGLPHQDDRVVRDGGVVAVRRPVAGRGGASRRAVPDLRRRRRVHPHVQAVATRAAATVGEPPRLGRRRREPAQPARPRAGGAGQPQPAGSTRPAAFFLVTG